MDNINKILNFLFKSMDTSNIGYSIICFIIGYYMCLCIKKICKKTLRKLNVTETGINFLSILLHFILLTILIIYCLEILGIKVTETLSILGQILSVLIIGISLAFQELFVNIGSSFLIIMFKPFKENDYIVGAGVEGRVKEVKLSGTLLKTIDNKIITIPNSKLINDNVINYTHENIRRVDLVLNVSYDSDIKLIKKIIKEEVLDIHNNIINRENYIIGVSEITNTEIKICVKFWVNTEDYWNTYYDILEEIVYVFRKHNINRPCNTNIIIQNKKYLNSY